MLKDGTVTPNVNQAAPFFRVTDTEASLRFYVHAWDSASSGNGDRKARVVASNGAGFNSATPL
jgi:hypothetical protein